MVLTKLSLLHLYDSVFPVDEGMKSYRGKLSYLPADAVTSSSSNSDSNNSGDDNSAAIETPLLPPLNSPVPDNWITVDTEFILVGAVYQSHLAKDNRMAVHSKLNDGHIHLLWVKTGISRIGSFAFLIHTLTGLLDSAIFSVFMYSWKVSYITI